MRVLQINTWYSEWSTGKLTEHIHKYLLKEGIDSFVCFGRGKKCTSPNIYNFCPRVESLFNSFLSRVTCSLYGGVYSSNKRLIRIIEDIKPDIVHIHCTNSFVINNFKLLDYLGKKEYKIVYTLHAEYPYTGNCGHSFECLQWIDGCQKCPNLKYVSKHMMFDRTHSNWKKMNAAFETIKKDNRRIVAVSDWLKDRAQQSKTFCNDQIVTISNGIDTDVFKRVENSKYTHLKEEGVKNILFIVPNFDYKIGDNKGCDTFIEIVKKCQNDNIKFIVAGDNRNGFDFSLFKNIVYLGKISNPADCAALYSVCDATLLLSIRETYSLVTAESISCGTPIIGIKCGAPETIALKNYSFFFDRENLGDLIDFLKTDTYIKKIPNILFTDFYSSQKMCKEYMKIYLELLNGVSKGDL